MAIVLIEENSTHFMMTARDARAEQQLVCRRHNAQGGDSANYPIELSKRCVGEAKRREAARHRHRQHTSVGQRFVGVKGLSVRVRVETIGMGFRVSKTRVKVS